MHRATRKFPLQRISAIHSGMHPHLLSIGPQDYPSLHLAYFARHQLLLGPSWPFSPEQFAFAFPAQAHRFLPLAPILTRDGLP